MDRDALLGGRGEHGLTTSLTVPPADVPSASAYNGLSDEGAHGAVPFGIFVSLSQAANDLLHFFKVWWQRVWLCLRRDCIREDYGGYDGDRGAVVDSEGVNWCPWSAHWHPSRRAAVEAVDTLHNDHSCGTSGPDGAFAHRGYAPPRSHTSHNKRSSSVSPDFRSPSSGPDPVCAVSASRDTHEVASWSLPLGSQKRSFLQGIPTPVAVLKEGYRREWAACRAGTDTCTGTQDARNGVAHSEARCVPNKGRFSDDDLLRAPRANSRSTEDNGLTWTSGAVEDIDAERASIVSLESLSQFLSRYSTFLPVRLEVEEERTCSGPAAGAGPLNHPAGIQHGAMVHADGLGVTYYCLHVLGPIQPSWDPAILHLVEDVLLDDCDACHLRLSYLHYADLVFSYDAHSGEPAALPEAGGHRAESNSQLDLLLFPSDQGSGSGERAPVKAPSSRPVWHSRLLGFLRRVMDGGKHSIHTIHLTRCIIPPPEIARLLPVSLTSLRRLLFQQCPLVSGHVEALLQLVRSERYTRGSSSPSALLMLTELQLSGTLTAEAIGDLLTYLSTESRGDSVLHLLRIPTDLISATKKHYFFESHPSVTLIGV